MLYDPLLHKKHREGGYHPHSELPLAVCRREAGTPRVNPKILRLIPNLGAYCLLDLEIVWMSILFNFYTLFSSF